MDTKSFHDWLLKNKPTLACLVNEVKGTLKVNGHGVELAIGEGANPAADEALHKDQMVRHLRVEFAKWQEAQRAKLDGTQAAQA